jgi:hypothetical protein
LTWIEADIGEMVVDIHPLAPERRNHDWGLAPVKTGSQFKQTMRLEIQPAFADSVVTMINMLYIRPSTARPLQWIRAGLSGRQATIRYYRDQTLHTITFNLDTHEIGLSQQ